MIEVRALDIADVCEIRTTRFADERGFFSEVWNAYSWANAGLATQFVQENHSLSRRAGVLRGLHFQTPPFAQEKLVRVTRGSIFDVAVDLRRGSESFGKYVSLLVSADSWNQILIPEGFAHGFLTLEPDTEVQYKVSRPYSADHDRSIRFDDPAIAIDWPVAADKLILSDKDRAAPLLADVVSGF
ncbi:dTDP-4-dehydrorhamnose 3,5-epimerase [Sphingomonas sp. RB1R13]|uniref:dTDP-4-dehydrorhamnose 3,5-epimerase n=1 Tax=Sphingomonas sp. RB1R13 TaxID=3096159 RepID=UPI002FC8B986